MDPYSEKQEYALKVYLTMLANLGLTAFSCFKLCCSIVSTVYLIFLFLITRGHCFHNKVQKLFWLFILKPQLGFSC